MKQLTNGWGSSADNNTSYYNGWGLVDGLVVGTTHPEATSSGCMNEPGKGDYRGWSLCDSMPVNNSARHAQTVAISHMFRQLLLMHLFGRRFWSRANHLSKHLFQSGRLLYFIHKMMELLYPMI